MFGMDCGKSDDYVDGLGPSGEARGTSVGVMVCFEHFSNALGTLQQKRSLGGDATEVGNDGIDDDDGVGQTCIVRELRTVGSPRLLSVTSLLLFLSGTLILITPRSENASL